VTDSRPFARQAWLLLVSFVATVAILAGLLAVVSGRELRTSGSPATVAVAPGLLGSPSASVGAINPSPNAFADPVLVGAGDIADCGPSGDEATANLLDGIAGTIFTAGDNAYSDGTAEQFARCYDPTWGRFKARTRPAAGNHDWLTKGAAGYLGYFGRAATNADGQTWYSYDLGHWHIIVLDSDCAEVEGCDSASVEGQWLAADLATSKATCTLAIWHHPRFSSGDHGNDIDVAPYWQALYAAGAEIVVNGHDHDYERFKPQAPSGAVDLAKGIREFVVGTGGTPLRPFKSSQPNSDIRATVAPGVLKLTLHPGSYDWAFVSTTGIFSDSGSATCH
jgi:acid phosphatase type 7